MTKVSLSEVRQYAHDSSPVPYCGTGEEYSVYPGNVRTTRYRFSLSVEADSASLEEVEDLRERIVDMLKREGIG
jgi:hypothetical protein